MLIMFHVEVFSISDLFSELVSIIAYLNNDFLVANFFTSLLNLDRTFDYNVETV